jgi:hypothetical protein
VLGASTPHHLAQVAKSVRVHLNHFMETVIAIIILLIIFKSIFLRYVFKYPPGTDLKTILKCTL